MLKASIPKSAWALIKDLPPEEVPGDVKLFAAIVEELLSCIRYAAEAREPQINFSEMRKAGSQYIWEFSVNDLSKQKEDRYNWHGQNVSQWLYAGCVLLENGKVSTHH